jgi:C1A family cysteine protease
VIDPKRALTKLRDEHPLAETVATGAAFDSGIDTLAADSSVTTVEEVLALSMLGGDLPDRISISPAEVARLLEHYRSSPEGAAEIASWDRYRALEYATGLTLDLAAPPPSTLAVTGARVNAVAAPASVSLLDEHLSPIRDQAQRGTCTAFAALACFEYHEHRSTGRAGIDLSEQFAYWNMVEQSAHHDLLSMFMGLRNDGTCFEDTWPYVPTDVPGNDAQGPPPPVATREAHDHRTGAVRQIPARDVGQIRDAIGLQLPVAIGVPVYASWFESPVVRKYGNITVPLPGEAPEPIGHAVALVGYADDQEFAGGGYFVVRNSWGGTWATESEFGAGYGTIPYRYVQGYNWDAWCINPPAGR